MDISRRRLLGSLGATAAVSGGAGCTFGRGEECATVEDSLETTVADGSSVGIDPLADAWPMRYNDAGGTGYTDGAGPRRDVEHRRLFTGEGGFFPSIVVGNGRVYVTSRRAELLAIDPTDGSVDWRYDQLDAGGSTAAVTDDLVVVVSRNGLHALDATGGEQRWRLEGPQFSGEGIVLVEDDTAYADTWEQTLAVDVATGEVNWRIDAPHLGAVADGRVFLNDWGRLRAVDASDGRTLWQLDEARSEDAVAVRDGTVYISSSGDTHFGDVPARVYALDAADGSEQWQFRTDPTGSFRSPAIAPDALAMGSYGGDVFVLDREDGRQRWCANFGRWDVAAPAIGDDALYVVTGDVVQARRLEDGEPLWTKLVDEDQVFSREERDFYHQQALVDGFLLVVGYGPQGLVIDAFLEQ